MDSIVLVGFILDSRIAATSNGSNSTLSHLSQRGDSSPEKHHYIRCLSLQTEEFISLKMKMTARYLCSEHAGNPKNLETVYN